MGLLHRCAAMAKDAVVEVQSVATAAVPEDPGLAAGALAVGALGAGVALWRSGWLRRFGLLALAMYSRLRRDDVVGHPTRRRILEAVVGRPGVTTAEVSSALGLNAGTLTYHLERLEQAGFVKSLRSGRDRVWYEAGAKPSVAADALRAPTRRMLLDLVLARPGLSESELAREAGVAKATAHHHVRELEAAGLLARRRDGLRVRCYPVGA